jgi:phosphocarrier protein HPr
VPNIRPDGIVRRYITGADTLNSAVNEADVEIKNEQGLHMRPAMQFVDIANRYKSTITVSNGQTKVDGKSIMEISMLAATCGSRLKIRIEGPDAADAMQALRELVEERHFDEPLPKPKNTIGHSNIGRTQGQYDGN